MEDRPSADQGLVFAQQVGIFHANVAIFAGQVGGIAAQVGGFAAQVGGIAAQVGGFAAQVGGLAAQVGIFAGQVGGLAAQVGIFACQVRGIAAKVGGFAAKVGIFAEQVGGIDLIVRPCNSQVERGRAQFAKLTEIAHLPDCELGMLSLTTYRLRLFEHPICRVLTSNARAEHRSGKNACASID